MLALILWDVPRRFARLTWGAVLLSLRKLGALRTIGLMAALLGVAWLAFKTISFTAWLAALPLLGGKFALIGALFLAIVLSGKLKAFWNWLI